MELSYILAEKKKKDNFIILEKIDIKIPLKAKYKLIFIMKICLYFIM